MLRRLHCGVQEWWGNPPRPQVPHPGRHAIGDGACGVCDSGGTWGQPAGSDPGQLAVHPQVLCLPHHQHGAEHCDGAVCDARAGVHDRSGGPRGGTVQQAEDRADPGAWGVVLLPGRIGQQVGQRGDVLPGADRRPGEVCAADRDLPDGILRSGFPDGPGSHGVCHRGPGAGRRGAILLPRRAEVWADADGQHSGTVPALQGARLGHAAGSLPAGRAGHLCRACNWCPAGHWATGDDRAGALPLPGAQRVGLGAGAVRGCRGGDCMYPGPGAVHAGLEAAADDLLVAVAPSADCGDHALRLPTAPAHHWPGLGLRRGDHRPGDGAAGAGPWTGGVAGQQAGQEGGRRQGRRRRGPRGAPHRARCSWRGQAHGDVPGLGDAHEAGQAGPHPAHRNQEEGRQQAQGPARAHHHHHRLSLRGGIGPQRHQRRGDRDAGRSGGWGACQPGRLRSGHPGFPVPHPHRGGPVLHDCDGEICGFDHPPVQRALRRGEGVVQQVSGLRGGACTTRGGAPGGLPSVRPESRAEGAVAVHLSDAHHGGARRGGACAGARFGGSGRGGRCRGRSG
eukprot:RCo022444